jgi:transcription elongation factor Elf1
VVEVVDGPRRVELLPDRAARRLRRAPTTSSKEIGMAETYSGEFYCVKCKEKREASGEVHVNDKGTRMAKATCPVCGTNLNRILGKA